MRKKKKWVPKFKATTFESFAPRRVWVHGDPIPDCFRYKHMVDPDWPEHLMEIMDQNPAYNMAEKKIAWEKGLREAAAQRRTDALHIHEQIVDQNITRAELNDAAKVAVTEIEGKGVEVKRLVPEEDEEDED